MENLLYSLTFSVFFALLAHGYEDDFSLKEKESRLINRGKWFFQDNEAHCTWDEDVIQIIERKDKTVTKKSASIGWNAGFTDGSVEFEIWRAENKSVLIGFNHNTKGHIFSLNLAHGKSGLTLWGKDLELGQKHSTHQKEKAVIPSLSGMEALKEGEWTAVKFTFSGEKLHIKIGEEEAEVEHSAFGRDKEYTQLNFINGTVRLRHFRITPEVKQKL